MIKSYCEITLPPADRDDLTINLFILSLLLSRLHEAAHGHRYAVAFPGLKHAEAKKSPANFGQTLRIFTSDEEALKRHITCTPVERVLAAHCSVSPVRVVPWFRVSEYEQFCRVRNADKATPAQVRRILKKGLNQSPFNKKVSALAEGGLTEDEIVARLRQPSIYPHFKHVSKSTSGHIAYIYTGRFPVEKNIADKVKNSDSLLSGSFGLSNSSCVQPVPVF
jgi:hypothetical protein